MTLEFTVPRDTHVSLGVYDLSGRLIRVLVEGGVTAGPHMARWDGRDDHGATAPSGVYFAHLIADGVRDVRRIAVLK